MIVNKNKYIKSGRNIVIVTAIISFLLILFLGSSIRPDNLPFEFVAIIEALCGCVVGISLGLFISEETRIYGFIYFLIFILLPVAVIVAGEITSSPVTLDVFMTYYGLGIAAGTIIAFMSLLIGKMNLVVTFLKLDFVILTVTVTVSMLWFGVLTHLINNPDISSFIQSIDFWLPFASAAACIALCIIVSKMTINIRGSDVFVIGPAGSGKTVLGIGLWDTFKHKKTDKFSIGKIGGYKEIYNGILSKRDNPSDISLRDLHYKITDKKSYSAIDSTKPGDLVMFKAKKNVLGLFPVTWTIIDYAGEYYEQLNYENYHSSLEIVKETLNSEPAAHKKGKTSSPWDEKRIEKAACSGELIDAVNSSRKYDYINNTNKFQYSLSIVIIYSNYMNAGKSVFLVDGDQVVDKYREWKANRDRITYNDDKIWTKRIVDKYNDLIEKKHIGYNKAFTELEIDEIKKILAVSSKNINTTVSEDTDEDETNWNDIYFNISSVNSVSSSTHSSADSKDDDMHILQKIIDNYKGLAEKKVPLHEVWKNYINMMKELKDLKIRKKIAICVTKVDKICLDHPIMQTKMKEIYREQNNANITGPVPLSFILNKKSVEAKVNTALYESLESTEGVHFTGIFDEYYASSSIPMYFIGTCLDALSPDGIHVAIGDDNSLYPLGYDELLIFGTTGRFILFDKLAKLIKKPRDDE